MSKELSDAIAFFQDHSDWLSRNWSMTPEGREYKTQFEKHVKALAADRALNAKAALSKPAKSDEDANLTAAYMAGKYAGRLQERALWELAASSQEIDALSKPAAQGGEAEVVMWQMRWTNPGNYSNQNKKQLAWKEVEPHMRTQSLEQRLEELRSSTYEGRPCYELRALVVAPQPKGADPTDAETKP